jgi:hypothetical protein
MPKALLSHLRSNVVGYLALFLTLTGGTAFALQGHNTVRSDDIVNGAVRLKDLKKGLGADGVVITQKKTLTASAPFTTIATTTITLARAPAVPLVGSTVEAVNNGASDAVLTLRVLHDGEAEGGEFSYTIAAGATQSVTAYGSSDPCVLPGAHTFQLQALSDASLTLQDRSLAVAALPGV